MAQNQVIIDLSETGWTQVTNAAVTTITFQAVQGNAYVRGTVGAAAPASTVLDGMLVPYSFGEVARTMTALFTGAGINQIYARAASPGARIYVDHA